MQEVPAHVTRLHPRWEMTLTFRVLPSKGGIVLTATAHGEGMPDHLVALEMSHIPLTDEILSQFETAVFSDLESALERMQGIQGMLTLH